MLAKSVEEYCLLAGNIGHAVEVIESLAGTCAQDYEKICHILEAIEHPTTRKRCAITVLRWVPTNMDPMIQEAYTKRLVKIIRRTSTEVSWLDLEECLVYAPSRSILIEIAALLVHKKWIECVLDTPMETKFVNHDSPMFTEVVKLCSVFQFDHLLSLLMRYDNNGNCTNQVYETMKRIRTGLKF